MEARVSSGAGCGGAWFACRPAAHAPFSLYFAGRCFAFCFRSSASSARRRNSLDMIPSAPRRLAKGTHVRHCHEVEALFSLNVHAGCHQTWFLPKGLPPAKVLIKN